MVKLYLYRDMMAEPFELPCEICIDGRKYAVNTDFRVWISIGKIISDPKKEILQKAQEVLILAYSDTLPPTLDTALGEIIKFYRAGEEEGDRSHDMPIVDFYTDFGMIAAAFLHDYSIDLWSEKLHWWKFRALFSCLREENKLIKVMGYRAVNIADIADKRQRKFYSKMKKIYRLQDERSDAQREACLIDKLGSIFEEVE